MAFGDLSTLYLFGVFVLIHWIIPRYLQLYWFTLFPAILLIYQGHLQTLLMLAALTPLCFILGRTSAGEYRSRLLVGIIFLCATFLVYKLAQALAAGDGGSFVLLGASFYLLKMIHYLIESRNRALQQHSLIEFSAYMFFAPTLLVGPINRFPEFLRDEKRRRWDEKLFYTGLERILFGYFKVVVLANYLLDTKLEIYIESIGGDQTPLGVWLGCVEYGLDLYFRFGGFCDIAIGLSALVGFRIIENFNYPFFRTNISAFWRSWHISLSSWCRDYVFTPVAFALKKPALGIIASMLILGIWHELSLRYIAWGLYHGAGIVIFQQWSRTKAQLPGWFKLPGFVAAPLGMALTFNFVVLSFAITRSDDLANALSLYITMFGGG